MSKAVLVIHSIPDNCRNCHLCDKDKDFNRTYCIPKMMYHRRYDDKRPDWCPLREAPIKKVSDPINDCDIDFGLVVGYNACLKEILGE